MPRLLVNIGTQRNQVFELTPGEIMIGRDKDAGLQLPNESVSRQHARLVVDARGVTVEDNASGNGTLVNERPLVAPRKLESGDEVRVGKFTLVFLTDERRDLFYKGRAVKYMPVWSPRQDLAPAHTFLLSKDALRAIQDQHNLIEDARIVLDRDPSRFWCPEDHKITFGSGSALIRPRGWYVWGDVAQVIWDGKHHVLESLVLWVPVKVNEQNVSAGRPLRPGDRFRVAQSRFRYEVS